MIARSARPRRSSARKPSATRNRVLRTEALESRALLSGYGLWYSAAGLYAAGAKTASTNAAPTVSQAIVINNNATVTGKTAALSVLGADDASESALKYTWSMAAGPSGGKATFSINGNNAAKYDTATFTKAGTYTLSVKIVDAGGLSTTSSRTVVVAPTLTTLNLATSKGQAISSTTALSVSGTSQALAIQGLDQFGNALATSPSYTWSILAVPTGANQPSLAVNASAATVTFSKAGAYKVGVAATAAGVSLSGNWSMNVLQVPTTIKGASTTPVIVTGTTVVPAIPAFLDQFGDTLSAAPTLTWSVSQKPSGAATPKFTTTGGVTTVTFGTAGSYSLQAKSGSLSFTTAVTVQQTFTTLSLATSKGQALSATSAFTVGTASQALVAQGLDQFGSAMASSPSYTWSILAAPAGAAQPGLTVNGASATVSFSKAGAYKVGVQVAAAGVTMSGAWSMNVVPVLTTIKGASTTPVIVTGTTLTPAIPLFLDQFGEQLSPAPALTWSVAQKPSGAAAPKFTTTGGVTTVAFAAAGNYMLQAKGTSLASLSFVTVVNVQQTLTTVSVTPGTCTVYQGFDQQFSASALDQFGLAMTTQPTLAWSATAGTISAAGKYTAPGSFAGSATVTAASGAVKGTATVTVAAWNAKWQNQALGSVIQTCDADGAIDRADMIRILQSAGTDGTVDAAELADLKSMLNQATLLNIPGYVQVLAGDVINGNAANAKYQGASLGNLAAGSSATQLTKLINKWFYGSDHPTICNSSLTYKAATSPLFAHTPSHLDEYQGMLGDCYFISALGTLADSNPAAIQNMFLDNGDGTYTVRFYTGNYGTIYNYSDGSIGAGFKDNLISVDYVTVDRMLPASSYGYLGYAGYGFSCTDASASLWIPLAEKAYAQWNETGKEGRDGTNTYAATQGGWMATVDAQVLGYNAIDYIMTNTGKQVAINALAAHEAVTIGTNSWTGTKYGLYATHAYAIVGYNAGTDTFTLYNPWGSNQPGQLTWSQLQSACSQMCVCDTSGTKPITGAKGVQGKAVSAAVSEGQLAAVANAAQALQAIWTDQAAAASQPAHHEWSPALVDATFASGL